MSTQPQIKNPGLAAVLSFLFNGLGQIYNGQIGKGLLIIGLQIVNALLTFIIIGFITMPIVFIWSVYDAYAVAKQINEQGEQHVLVHSKQCPQCAERVQNDAKVCRFCGHQFERVGV